MAENQENIEARLCDYIEGQLDPAGRAEIEQHLAANAEHRTLIAELQAQRAMVRQLPRVRAPGDIGESMESQLEREALLGRAVDAPEETVVRIRPWPRVWAVAATLLLTAGLAAVVYYVLPSARPSAEFASSNGRTEAPAATTLETDEVATNPARDLNASAAHVGGLNSPTTAPSSVGANTALAMGDRKEGGSPLAASPGAVSTPAAPVASASGAGTPGAPNGDELDAESRRIAGSGAAAVTATNDAAVTEALRDQLAKAGVDSNPLLVMVDTDNAAAASGDVRQYLAANHIIYEPLSGVTLPNGNAAMNTATATFSLPRDQRGSANDSGSRSIGSIVLPPILPGGALSPAATNDASRSNASSTAARPAATMPANTTMANSGSATNVEPPPPPQQSVLVLRNVTRRQANDLAHQFAGEAATQPAMSFNVNRMQSGALSKVKLVQLGTPTTQPAQATNVSPTTAPSSNATPTTQPVTNAGESATPDSRGALGDGISPAPVPPSTQPAIAADGATTRPSDNTALTASGGDDRLDVVIVVRNDVAMQMSNKSAATTAPAPAPDTSSEIDPATPLPIPETAPKSLPPPTTAPPTQPAADGTRS